MRNQLLYSIICRLYELALEKIKSKDVIDMNKYLSLKRQFHLFKAQNSHLQN